MTENLAKFSFCRPDQQGRFPTDAIHYPAILIVISLALGLTFRPAIASESTDACAISTGKWIEERTKNCLQDPGWFDIGAGIVVIPKAGIAQQNGIGNMITLRAYPFGRWYSSLKSQTSASAEMAKLKIDFAKKLNSDAAASKKLADEAAIEAAKSLANAAAGAEAATSTTDAKDKAAKAANDQSAADAANVDAAQGMQAALNAFGNSYAVEELKGITHWGHRVSFFFGRSIGGFDVKAVNGDINAFGIAFDIAPQFSVVWGRAYFNQQDQTGVANSSQSRALFGVQINLNAFKAMRGLTGSL